ncbi:MAG TPA: glycosyltransferase family 2 protein [Chloroflexota bacterium]
MTQQTAVPRVGIVLVNWNKAADTVACLESRGRLDYDPFEVVVVDNASTDGSPATIRRHFPEIALIENSGNLGFAAGNNVGVRYLMDRGVDYVLLLNNDTEVAPNLVRSLIDVSERDPGIGIVGPKILYYQPDDLIWSAGGLIDHLGRSSHLHFDEVDSGVDQRPRDVDYVTGCALLIRRSVIEKVGVLDERFFMYYEEAEWCARVRAAGYRVVYVPEARMWHKIQQSARNNSRQYLYLMTRNRLLYLRCTHASAAKTTAACLDVLRTSAAWTLKRKHREARPLAGALVHGVWDGLLGRFGAPPARL